MGEYTLSPSRGVSQWLFATILPVVFQRCAPESSPAAAYVVFGAAGWPCFEGINCRSRKSVEYGFGVGKLGPTAPLIYNSLEILSDLSLAQIALRYAFPKAKILVHHDQDDDPALQEASKGE